MTRGEFEKIVFDKYNVRADYPFEEDCETGVFLPSNKDYSDERRRNLLLQDAKNNAKQKERRFE